MSHLVMPTNGRMKLQKYAIIVQLIVKVAQETQIVFHAHKAFIGKTMNVSSVILPAKHALSHQNA